MTTTAPTTDAPQIRYEIDAAVDLLVRAARVQADDRREENVLALVEDLIEFQRFTLIHGTADLDTAVRFLAYADEALSAYIRRTKGMTQWRSQRGRTRFACALDHLSAARRRIRGYRRQAGVR